MKKTGKFLSILLCVAMLASVTACNFMQEECTSHKDADNNGVCDVCKKQMNSEGNSSSDEGGNTNQGEKTVSSIEVKTNPKTEYFVDEAFSLEGGVITVKYSDGTSEDIAMTDESLDITAPSTARAGTKTVTIKYEGKKTTYKVSVVTKGLTVSFNLNYENSTAIEQNVVKGYSAEEIDAPTREGYTFYDWYTDAACTILYDFESVVNEDTTIYAKWKENGATYYSVKYNMNYYRYIQVAMTIMSPETEEREYKPFGMIRDNYPKYLLTIDTLLQKRDGVIHKNIIEFISADENL